MQTKIFSEPTKMPRLLTLIGLISLIVLASLPVQAQTDTNHARVELISERTLAMPGETVWMGLSFEIDPNWHIYWINPGDAGIPPEILWSESLPVEADQIGDFRWPLPELLPVVPGQIMDYGYSDQIVLPFPVTLPDDVDGPILFEGIADYLICEDICIPESAPIRLMLSTGAAQVPDALGSELIQAALSEVPPKFKGQAHLTSNGDNWVLSLSGGTLQGERGEARFFPFDHEIKHAADQMVQFGENGLQITLTPKSEGTEVETLAGVVRIGNAAVEVEAVSGAVLPGTSGTSSGLAVSLPLLLVFALLGGLILNLMPCVLPVLSIKAMGLVSSAANGNAQEARIHGLWYTAGVLVSFGALAGLVLSVRAATGIAIWGFWLQNALIVTGLILIIFLIGLWLLGLFELGSSVQNVGSGLAAKQGSAGAFFTGVLAAIVGAPCTGPFLGAALGAVMTQPAPLVVLVLLAMGLGMALPFLLLSFLPSLQRLIPKPGAWMETLKQVFAFPMFLTAAWLLSVLGALAGYRTAALVVAGAALIAFGVWALKSAGQGAKAILLSVLGLAIIIPVFGLVSARSGAEIAIGLFWVAVLIGGFVLIARLQGNIASTLARGVAGFAIIGGLVWPLAQVAQSKPPEAGQTTYSATYPTEAWSSARVSELLLQGRPVFVDFTAEWCVTCQANKLQTLQTRAVSEVFEAANVAFLVADFTDGDPDIAMELQRRGRAGVPMYLWYEAGASEPEVLPELLSVDLVTGLVQ